MLTALAILINWPLAYSEMNSQGLHQLESSIDFKATTLDTPENPLPVMAGWPKRYWISYPDSDDTNAGNAVSLFPLSSFFFDAAIAAALVGFVLVYLWRRGSKNRTATTDTEPTNEGTKAPAFNIKLSIADLLFLTLLIAAPLGLWGLQDRQSKQQLELAHLIRHSDGKVEMSAWVPQFIKTHIPRSIRGSLSRVRGVQIEHPSVEIVQRILDCREMTTLRLGGGKYDLELLHQLPKNPHLLDLRIGGREINNGVVQSIARLPRLESLNLIRTNVDQAMLQPQKKLARLKNVGLIRTKVLQSDFFHAPFSQSVQQLILPHPIKTASKSARKRSTETSARRPENKLIRISLSSWPKLRTVAFSDLDSLATEQLIEVKLSDLPKLESIEVDRFSVAGTPSLKLLNLGAYRIQSDLQPRYLPLPQAASTAIINGFKPNAAPEKIDFDSVSLGRSDLSPLIQHAKLISLSLNKTGIGFDSVKSLAGASHLQHLAINDMLIDFNQIEHDADRKRAH